MLTTVPAFMYSTFTHLKPFLDYGTFDSFGCGMLTIVDANLWYSSVQNQYVF